MTTNRRCLLSGCPTWPPLRMLDDRGHFDKLDLFSCEEHRGAVFTCFFGNGLRVRFENQTDPEKYFAAGGLFAAHARHEHDCLTCGGHEPRGEVCAVRGCTGVVHVQWEKDTNPGMNRLHRRCDRCGYDHMRARPD
jgi:hypothetical protein